MSCTELDGSPELVHNSKVGQPLVPCPAPRSKGQKNFPASPQSSKGTAHRPHHGVPGEHPLPCTGTRPKQPLWGAGPETISSISTGPRGLAESRKTFQELVKSSHPLTQQSYSAWSLLIGRTVFKDLCEKSSSGVRGDGGHTSPGHPKGAVK